MALNLFAPSAFPAGLLAGSAPLSPLMLADRLITLAQDADRAGLTEAASQIVGLVYSVLDTAPGEKN